MDITKIFDVHSSPKTVEELYSLRKRYKKNTLIVTAGIGIMLIVLFVLFYQDVKYHHVTDLVFVITAVVTYVVFIRVKNSILSIFQPINLKYALDLLTWCEIDKVISVYQNAVAAQKRSLVKGEYWSMKEWKESGKQAEEQKAKEKVAFEKLSKPIAYKGENK